MVVTAAVSVILRGIVSPAPPKDAQIYSGLVTVITLGIATALTRLNHLHTRRSSTILLSFYPLYFIAKLVALRTSYALLDSDKLAVAEIAVSIAHISLLFVVWMLECVGPEVDDMVDGFVNVDEKVKESPYMTANLYSRYVLSSFT